VLAAVVGSEISGLLGVPDRISLHLEISAGGVSNGEIGIGSVKLGQIGGGSRGIAQIVKSRRSVGE